MAYSSAFRACRAWHFEPVGLSPPNRRRDVPRCLQNSQGNLEATGLLQSEAQEHLRQPGPQALYIFQLQNYSLNSKLSSETSIFALLSDISKISNERRKEAVTEAAAPQLETCILILQFTLNLKL